MSSFPLPPSAGAAGVTLSRPRREIVLRKLAYIALGLPLGVVYASFILAGLLLGVLLGVFWIGLPLMLAAASGVWRLAAIERTLANNLLGARIPPLAPLPAGSEGGLRRRVARRLGSRAFWRGVLLLALRLPLSALGAGVVALGVFLVAALLVLGVGGIAGTRSGYVGPFGLDAGLGILLVLLAVPTGILTIAFADWAGYVLRALTRALLMTPLTAGAPVREALAESLGDRTLSIAYWLPERASFVDEGGHPVQLPEPGSQRAWTPVDYQGRRVAAIVHDVSLVASPELLQAAAAAASLALDNEQLKAELRARVEELRASRIRIVEASNAARRKVERDLHDGAQQQLVALAVELKLLRGRVGSNGEALELINGIEGKLSAALDELRELARGIHPGILTDRGLAPAIDALASRGPLPIVVELDLPDRPPASVETVGYYVVSEAITNVLKYARASRATIRARYDGEDVLIETQDDGIGGADEGRGTGLQGLRDRVAALDGTFTVISEPGKGTLVRARIPRRGSELQ